MITETGFDIRKAITQYAQSVNFNKAIDTDMMSVTFDALIANAPFEIRELFAKCADVPQRADFHPEGDTAVHIRIVTMRCMLVNPTLMMAGLFHDLGKVETFAMTNGKPSAHGHEKVSAELVVKHAEWIEAMGGNAEQVEWIVANHMRFKKLNKMRRGKRAEIKQHPFFWSLEIFGRADSMVPGRMFHD